MKLLTQLLLQPEVRGTEGAGRSGAGRPLPLLRPWPCPRKRGGFETRFVRPSPGGAGGASLCGSGAGGAAHPSARGQTAGTRLSAPGAPGLGRDRHRHPLAGTRGHRDTGTRGQTDTHPHTSPRRRRAPRPFMKKLTSGGWAGPVPGHAPGAI